jgi:glycosyltransferase involved in cell wall biosynthesis
MRILIFHGYLLGGTGSNVYNARLAAALVGLGHEVHLLCQDRHPQDYSFIDADGDWDRGELRMHVLREPVRCTVYRPNIGSLLPVYVADRYDGIQARTFAQCTDREVARYIDANVAAVEQVAGRAEPELALANHLVMGPVILARALGGDIPYAVKVHGSALEYTVKPDPERFLGLAREGIAGARTVLVGSHHTAASLWEALGDADLKQRTRLGPPGVEVERFTPRTTADAAAGLRQLIAELSSSESGPGAESDPGVKSGSEAGSGPGAGSGVESNPGSGSGSRSGPGSGSGSGSQQEAPTSAFARDDRAAADALARLDPGHDRLVGFVGKLIVNKGIDLLIAAWPLVLARVPEARLVVVGFGADRETMELMRDALADGDLERVENMAENLGLRHLLAFMRNLREQASDDGKVRDECEEYLAAARALSERIVFTGRLDHDELAELLPVCEALVVPSTFPEAFGMVAVEAAACGALPISAAHSGLAEVSDVLADAVPAQVAPLLSFPVDDSSVTALAERIVAWLQIDPAVRERARAGLINTVRARWSWQGVARGVIAAARGELNLLSAP